MAKKRTKPVAEHIDAGPEKAPTENQAPPVVPESPPAETKTGESAESPGHAKREERKHPSDPLAIFAKRDWNQFADPKPIHSVRFPDGYEIHMQESPSRRTVEIQFNQGRREDQPKNFAAIKEVLHDAGLKWNGTNAWAIDLVPERGSFHEREMAKRRNKEIRTELEESVLPAVVGLEEQSRGQIELTDDYRQRIHNSLNDERNR